jgi:hypothetical protein
MHLLYTEITQHPSGKSNAVIVTHKSTHEGPKTMDATRYFMDPPKKSRGPGSSVGIATGYGLDGPGSNPGGGEIFRTCLDRPWDPPSLLYNG